MNFWFDLWVWINIHWVSSLNLAQSQWNLTPRFTSEFDVKSGSGLTDSDSVSGAKTEPWTINELRN